MESSISNTFPVGYESFNPNEHLNFELNRWYSFGCASRDDMARAGQQVHDFETWISTMTRMGDDAIQAGDLFHAAFFYRAAEFFTMQGDPRKEELYAKFLKYFYEFYGAENLERHEIPYEGKTLGAIRIPGTDPAKGTIVVHGGYDSFMEEMYPLFKAINNDSGYEIVLFEGPGQGMVLHKHGLPFTVEWEKPTKAILDHFHLADVTLVGISMGGFLALRAAAFEPRIARVVALDCFDGPLIAMNRFRGAQKSLVKLVLALRARSLLNRVLGKLIVSDLEQAWAFRHGMFVMGQPTPYDFSKSFMRFTIKPVASRITQDVLLLAGAEDHMIPIRCYEDQMKLIRNARSLTGRVFTMDEHASAHCQVGNIPLVLNTTVDWIKAHEQV
jgi:pimeloyl-ACP methyl ester carboxylesterase